MVSLSWDAITFCFFWGGEMLLLNEISWLSAENVLSWFSTVISLSMFLLEQAYDWYWCKWDIYSTNKVRLQLFCKQQKHLFGKWKFSCLVSSWNAEASSKVDADAICSVTSSGTTLTSANNCNYFNLTNYLWRFHAKFVQVFGKQFLHKVCGHCIIGIIW